ncbi:MAG: putative zinc-binding metallopeptidase [Gemmatimonadales bacterium]
MTTPPTAFRESNLWSTPIRDLGLTIAGTRLEPIVAEFEDELRRVGLTRLRPRFYLSTEWGVPFETVAIAIPFYLARPELTALHEEQTGHVEGFNRADILRYLRHEMGHVVSYAYRLYDDEEWVRRFGSITQPYEEDYRPEPFSRRFVRHLPGWYAQKHPDEDWAETFAVWMAPGFNWEKEYDSWPEALGKLWYCDRVMRQITARDPLVTTEELDEDVGEIGYSVADYYEDLGMDRSPDFPPGLDGALRAIFEESGDETAPDGKRPAADLLARLERSLMENVYRWTGHFPERTRVLVRHLAGRARDLELAYQAGDETAATTGLTTFVTALAMNHVHRGTYLP